jgi:nitrogen fixation NifU-like protein
MYTVAVLDHANNPRNQGDLADATAVVTVTNPVCGDELALAVRVANGKIAAARFRARGCTAAIACASVLTELITGKSAAEVWELSGESVVAALGGLPPATRHAAQLAEDAIDALLARL